MKNASQPKVPPALEKAEAALSTFGKQFPEVTEDYPWGHRTLKVRGKAFVFFSLEGGSFSFSVKLPKSNASALLLPFAEPTGYGLGKSGWVTARFGAKDRVPLTMVQEWIEESYRAVAPKRVIASLDTPNTATTKRKKLDAPKAAITKRKR